MLGCANLIKKTLKISQIADSKLFIIHFNSICVSDRSGNPFWRFFITKKIGA